MNTTENVECVLPDGQHIEVSPIVIDSYRDNNVSEKKVEHSIQFPIKIDESEIISDEDTISTHTSDSDEEDIGVPQLWFPHILVLGPGGMKGFKMIGLLGYMYDHELGSKLERIVGCSVGAILGLLYVIGYKPWEILTIGINFNIWPHISTMNIWQSFLNTGLLPSQYLSEPLTKLVISKYGYVPTMRQLYDLTHIIYTVVTYNTTAEEPFYFDHITNPNLSSVDAATMSACMPLIFQKFLYNTDYYVDGALGNPYPVDKYDDGQTPILGVYLTNNSTSEDYAAHLHRSSGPKHNDLRHILVDIDNFINAPVKQLRKRIIRQSSPACRHVGLTSNIIDITGITVSTENRVKEYWEGYRKAESLWQEDQIITLCPSDKDHIPIQPFTRKYSSWSYHPPHQYGIKTKTPNPTVNTDITSQQGLDTLKDAINTSVHNLDEARSVTGTIDRAIGRSSRFEKRHRGKKF